MTQSPRARFSAETGLVYHVLAAFGDTRLPAEYVGTGAHNGSMAMKAAVIGGTA